MNEIQDRLNEIEKIKRTYADRGVRIPIEVCQDILAQEQAAIVKLYLEELDCGSYEKKIAENLGRPQISDLLSGGLDHDANTFVLSNMDEKVEKLKNSKEKNQNGIINREDVVDDPSYLEYMVNTDGVALDHYLTIFPHELRHLLGAAGDSELEGFGFIAEGKTELDTRRICKKNGIEYYMGRNYTEEAAYVKKLEDIVGAKAIGDFVCFKSKRFSEMIDKFSDESQKQAMFDYIHCREGNSIKKTVALANPDFAERNFDALKKVSEYLEKVHPLEMTDELLDTNLELQNYFSQSSEFKGVISEAIREKREKMLLAKERLGEDFQIAEQEYNQIEQDRSNFFSANVVSKLNTYQIAELTDKISAFNKQYHSKDMTKEEQDKILLKAGVINIARQPEVVLESQNAEEAMLQMNRMTEVTKTDITVDEK